MDAKLPNLIVFLVLAAVTAGCGEDDPVSEPEPTATAPHPFDPGFYAVESDACRGSNATRSLDIEVLGISCEAAESLVQRQLRPDWMALELPPTTQPVGQGPRKFSSGSFECFSNGIAGGWQVTCAEEDRAVVFAPEG